MEIKTFADLPPRPGIEFARVSGFKTRPLPLVDGTLVTYEISPASGAVISAALRKQDRGGREVWSVPVIGNVTALAVDPERRLYLFGSALTVGGRTGTLLRILEDGRVDAQWSTEFQPLAATSASMRVVGERLIVAETAPTASRITTINTLTGRTIAERSLGETLGDIASDGRVMATRPDGYWTSFDPTQTDGRGDRVSAARVGVNGFFSSAVAWRGGYVIGGKFEYWFDGRRYRNLMRLDAAFRPDPSWLPEIDGDVSVVTVDRNGRLVAASNSLSGAEARLTRWNADSSIDSTWQPRFSGDIYALETSSDGMLFVSGAFTAVNGNPSSSIVRFLANDQLDAAWGAGQNWLREAPSRVGQFGRTGIFRIVDAGSNGVLFTEEIGGMNSFDGLMRRVDRGSPGQALPLPQSVASAVVSFIGGGSVLRDNQTGDVYALADAWNLSSGAERGSALVKMIAPSFTVDAAWTTFAGEYGQQFFAFAYQTDEHVYVCRGYVNREVRRFAKATGREDPTWRSDEHYLCGAKSFERRADGSTLVLSESTSPLARFGSATQDTDINVVEFYARAAKRFFITGRPAEIELLDSLPQLFTRTGMRFAAQSAIVASADTEREPVCRFYAPPDAGGSNTHFHGRDAECALLKRFPVFRYEGFDFRAGKPSNSRCTTGSTVAVYRMFNNAVATNNGNHRYVVSDTRRAEMVAAGWTDEGVAFCTTSAEDSRALPLIQ